VLGDGSSSSLFSPQRVYSIPGQYTASLTVFADNGCSNTITKDITVNRRLFAQFIPEDTLCQRKQGRYFDQSTAINDTINQWRWRFSAEAFKFDKNPTHAFQGTGSRLVRLTVRSVGGCVDSIQKQVNIIASPITDFEVEPDFGFPPFSPTLSNLSSGGTEFLWDFGNGNSFNGFNPVNPTYTDTGSYIARLVALNDLGCSDTTYREVNVYERFIAASINSLLCLPDGDFMKMTVGLTNESPFPFKEIKFVAHLNGSSLTSESWEGDLSGGQFLQYPFVAGVAIEGDPKYCCVQIVNVNDTLSINQGKTELCIPLTQEFTLTPPFPNPASNVLNLRFILPIEDEFTVEVFNLSGQRFPLDFKAAGDKGFNQASIDIQSLSNGMYFIRLTHRGEQRVAKFVVNN
jgi:PKD repeat protein